MPSKISLLLVFVLASGATSAAQTPGSARAAYERARGREQALTASGSESPAPRLVRRVIAQYESVARRYVRMGYADNALWQAGQLAAGLYERTGLAADRRCATRLLNQLVSSYPSSSLVPAARKSLRTFDTDRPQPPRATAAASQPLARTATRTRPAASTPPTVLKPEPAIATRTLPDLDRPASGTRPDPPAAGIAATAPGVPTARVRDVRRSLLPELVRVTIELDAEVPFHAEQIANPSRVFFDLQGAAPAAPIRDLLLTYDDEAVREIRLGQRSGNATRVVIETDGTTRYSVFNLYNPFRIVVDFERADQAAVSTIGRATWTPPSGTTLPPATTGADIPVPVDARPARTVSRSRSRTAASSADGKTGGASAESGGTPPPPLPPSIEPRETAPAILPAPEAPRANSTGGFSMSRQLGLGVARVVIDPGHGGHDPGALGKRLNEAELVLDVSLRLEKLLLAQPGIDVVLTRRTDQFVPLEQRTAIANREGADLFLSIHANASRNPKARGIETYFLNFATNPEAAAVAARENSASGRSMHALPDIVKAIALNNKVDESRDFATLVQEALVKRLQAQDKDVRNLGVKQAPFVVLIGAQMPSVLAEISFVTHQRESQLLRIGAYRQKIAEALFDSVLGYQRSLKSVGTVASQE